MPYALTSDTGRDWATNRAIGLFVVYAGDLAEDDLMRLHILSGPARKDGAKFVVVVPEGAHPNPAEMLFADMFVESVAPPSPIGLFVAMQAAEVADARKLGLIGGCAATLEAGHRANAAAIIGIAPVGIEARRALVDSQPDVIITAADFRDLDRERYCSVREHREYVLLNPGPSVTTDRVHRAVGGPDMCHREPEYSDLLDRIKQKLFTIAGVSDDWAMVMMAGSGTAAMEAMTGACVRPGHKLLVCKNGIYGERIETIARRLGTEVVLIESSTLEPIDPAQVGAALDADPLIDAVAVIHHETTTGLLNPVHEIAAEANKRGVLVACDAISSFGAEELDLNGTGIDFVASTSNKCLHGLPGAAFVLVSPRGQARINEVPPRSLYFDLPNYLKAQSKRTVPFTPAIPALYALDAALDELLDEGTDYRRSYYQARMDYLDAALSELGLEPRVAAGHRSRCVRSLPLPDGIDYDTLHDELKLRGYVIYAGLGDAAKTSFRVCALGAIKIEALQGFVAALEQTILQHSAVIA